MTYALGIDLGTTYTAAAVARNGRAEVAALGYRATSVPSVVLLTEDGRFLVGDAAERRATNEPNRVAREFKRRVGDSTPLMLGGTPVAVDRCLAEILRWVATTVGETEGGPPESVTVTHPANWGEFKRDVLREALRLADLPDSRLLAEPVAAATWYAQAQRLEAGHVVAVYDLGGGTFDAAVLRQGDDGSFETLGRAEGIERLGGIDIDQAVLGFVLRALGDDGARLASPDAEDDPAAVAALAQLRRSCVEAKEALSSETSVTIPVWLPGLHHEVLMHRTELEELVTPLLQPTVDALGRVVRSTGLRAADVHSVLLVGGSSRIPLIARQVSAGFGRPIAVDAHPKHPVALGAALDALHHPEPSPSPAGGPAGAGIGPGVPRVTMPTGAGAFGGQPGAAAAGSAPTATTPAGSPPPAGPGAEPWFSGPTPPPRPFGGPPPAPAPSYGPANDNRRILVGAAISTLVTLLAFLAFILLRPGDETPDVDTTSNDSDSPTTVDLDVPNDTPGLESTTPESPPGNIILGDPSAAFAAFGQIFDGAPITVHEIIMYPEDASISVQTPENPSFFDTYRWEGGDVATHEGETFIPPSEDEIAEGALFDFAEVNPSVIPAVAQEALSLCPGDGMELTHVIIEEWTAFDDQVTIRVYLSIPDRTYSGGSVDFTLAGELIENSCE